MSLQSDSSIFVRSFTWVIWTFFLYRWTTPHIRMSSSALSTVCLIFRQRFAANGSYFVGPSLYLGVASCMRSFIFPILLLTLADSHGESCTHTPAPQSALSSCCSECMRMPCWVPMSSRLTRRYMSWVKTMTCLCLASSMIISDTLSRILWSSDVTGSSKIMPELVWERVMSVKNSARATALNSPSLIMSFALALGSLHSFRFRAK